MAKKAKSGKSSKKNAAPRPPAKAPVEPQSAEEPVSRPLTDADSWTARVREPVARAANGAPGSGTRASGSGRKPPGDAGPPNAGLMREAAILLILATAVSGAMVFASFALPDGLAALRAIGGFITGPAVPETMRLVFGLDILFPVFYGASFAVLATAVQSRGNRPLVRIIITSVALAVIADFAENALVFNAMDSGEISSAHFPLTVIKYALLVFAGAMLSAVLPVTGALGLLVHWLLRYVFPVAGAVLISGAAGDEGRDAIAGTFPLMLALLAAYAWRNASTGQG